MISLFVLKTMTMSAFPNVGVINPLSLCMRILTCDEFKESIVPSVECVSRAQNKSEVRCMIN